MSGLHLVDMLNGRYVNHPAGCHCPDCERVRMFQLLDDLSRLRPAKKLEAL